MSPMPITTRYTLPSTPYFDGMRPNISLKGLAGYAYAEYLAGLIGTNRQSAFRVPLSGPHEYSPYGAGLVGRMIEDPKMVHQLSGRWSQAAVISPATAILGLGAANTDEEGVLRAIVADPIMQGKAKFFLWTAGVSATPLCVETRFAESELRRLKEMNGPARNEQTRVLRAQKFAELVRALAGNFGFINIEDAQGKDLPIILGALECLQGECAIWSDDKQGTGVITAAAMLSWAELTQRNMTDIRGIIFGAGAGSMGVYDELLNHGVKPENILVIDSKGEIREGRDDVNGDPFKVKMRMGMGADVTVETFAKGADFIINLGVKEMLTADLERTRRLIMSLAANPFFAPMTNPEPGIDPDQLHSF